MAEWKKKCGGGKMWINEVDHPPPHCHITAGGRHFKVDLWTLQALKPAGEELPAPLRACVRTYQEEMLKAWESVRLMTGGKK